MKEDRVICSSVRSRWTKPWQSFLGSEWAAGTGSMGSRDWQHGQKDGEAGEDASGANPREIEMPLEVKLVANILCDQEGRAGRGI